MSGENHIWRPMSSATDARAYRAYICRYQRASQRCHIEMSRVVTSDPGSTNSSQFPCTATPRWILQRNQADQRQPDAQENRHTDREETRSSTTFRRKSTWATPSLFLGRWGSFAHWPPAPQSLCPGRPICGRSGPNSNAVVRVRASGATGSTALFGQPNRESWEIERAGPERAGPPDYRDLTAG
jgi:hypothetical protein